MYSPINFLFLKAMNITSTMISLQLKLFWNIFERFLANPMKLIMDSSTRDMSLFLATANEKLMFDSLTEITDLGSLSKERERFLIIKTILQEYDDVIFGQNPWLSKHNLGSEFFNHLTHPEKTSAKRNRQRRFKQYTVILSI